jgi:hypothetical protein
MALGIGLISVVVDPRSYIQAANIERVINGNIEKAAEEGAKAAAEAMREHIKDAYASSSGKAAIKTSAGTIGGKYREGGSIPLYEYGQLLQNVIARPSASDHRKGGYAWEVTLNPGVRHGTGAFGPSPMTVLQIATLHEKGYYATLPQGTVVPVQARPIWKTTFDKYADEEAMKHIGSRLGTI